MIKRIQDCFIYLSAIILFVTAAAKIFTATCTAQALSTSDPLLFLSHRQIFYLMGSLELVLSALLLMGQDTRMKLVFIAWLATSFLVYRAGLWWTGAPDFCNCLGNINEYLNISPRILNAAALVALGWLIIGSYTLLMFDWFGQFRTVRPGSEPGAQNNSGMSI